MAKYTRLSNGSQGEEVKKLQQSLSDAGYSVGSAGVDGIYGSDTEAAVRRYQQDNGLAVDGIAGDETFGSLYNKSNAAPTNQQAPAASPAPQASAAPLTSQEPQSALYSPAYQAALDALQNAQNAMPTYAATYDEQLKALYDQIVNRDKFSYDINGDALYQQYKDQYVMQGQMAMMDTIGQTTALTGGYGNSYAQNAGQQAYQGYLQQLNDVVPELYGAALDRYTAEGDQLMNQYAMLGDLANDEYGRYQDALNQHWQNVSYLQGVADDEYGRQNDRYNRLVDLITTTGYTPNASELQNAGMSENEARAYADYYAQMIGGVGGGSGGGSSGAGSGGGGSDGGNEEDDDTDSDIELGRYAAALDNMFRNNENGRYSTYGARKSELDHYLENDLISDTEYNYLLNGAYGDDAYTTGNPAADFNGTTYSEAVAYMKANGVAAANASNILTESEFRRAKASGSSRYGANEFDSYEEYLQYAVYANINSR